MYGNHKPYIEIWLLRPLRRHGCFPALGLLVEAALWTEHPKYRPITQVARKYWQVEQRVVVGYVEVGGTIPEPVDVLVDSARVY